jgi:hypothetical protein
MIETRLYFGQARPSGPMITEAEWNNFKTNHIARVFKEGSTTISGTGNWHDTAIHQLIVEPTYVVSYLYKRSPKISRQIDSLVTLYKSMFRQQSVLRIDMKVQARF